jgi:hypothetical protein
MHRSISAVTFQAHTSFGILSMLMKQLVISYTPPRFLQTLKYNVKICVAQRQGYVLRNELLGHFIAVRMSYSVLNTNLDSIQPTAHLGYTA